MNLHRHIEIMAAQAQLEIARMANKAMSDISEMVHRELRSQGQRRRWHKFKQINGGGK